MYSSTLSLTSALDSGGWSTPCPGRISCWKDPVSIVKEAGWAAGPVGTGAENLAPTGIRSLGSSSPLRVAIPTYAIPAQNKRIIKKKGAN